MSEFSSQTFFLGGGGGGWGFQVLGGGVFGGGGGGGGLSFPHLAGLSFWVLDLRSEFSRHPSSTFHESFVFETSTTFNLLFTN